MGQMSFNGIEKYKENEAFIQQSSIKGIRNDPYKVSNAIVMEINFIAGQLFELSNNLAKILIYKPKKVYKILLDDY